VEVDPILTPVIAVDHQIEGASEERVQGVRGFEDSIWSVTMGVVEDLGKPYAGLIGSILWKCLDHVVVPNETLLGRRASDWSPKECLGQASACLRQDAQSRRLPIPLTGDSVDVQRHAQDSCSRPLGIVPSRGA